MPTTDAVLGVAAPVAQAAARVCDGILDAIGGTPLVRLRRYWPDVEFAVFAKLEGLNPGGSLKDRPAVRILEDALRAGIVRRGSMVIESSSGNMGIGLAQACRFYGLRFCCVVDPKTTEANLRVIAAYGGEIDFVSQPDPATGEFLQARIQRVQQLLRETPGAFWPNQYANRNNAAAHHDTTMHEVAAALCGKVDFLFVPTSTCGTLRGCSEYVHRHGLATQVIAVDALGSLIFGDVRGPRLVPGLGAGLRPELCDASLIAGHVYVTDLDCVVGCRRLMQREAMFVGGSSGGALAAIEVLRERIPPGATVVAILPDRGERYLDTLFSDEWVTAHFGNVRDLWQSERSTT